MKQKVLNFFSPITNITPLNADAANPLASWTADGRSIVSDSWGIVGLYVVKLFAEADIMATVPEITSLLKQLFIELYPSFLSAVSLEERYCKRRLFLNQRLDSTLT